MLCCFRIAIIKTDLNDQNLFLNFRPFVSFTESLLPRIQECIESKSAFIVYVDDKVTTMELVADIFAALPASVGNLAPVHAALTSSERADMIHLKVCRRPAVGHGCHGCVRNGT